MTETNHSFGDTSIEYNKRYISLLLKLSKLPASLAVEEYKLHLRSSFHVSLVCVKNILVDCPDSEEVILDTFESFLKKQEITFSNFTGEFRLATVNERVSVVAMCEVLNLKDFFDALNKKLKSNIPYQPTHVTLYTLQPDAGIGLNSQAELEKLSRPIAVPDLANSNIRAI